MGPKVRCRNSPEREGPLLAPTLEGRKKVHSEFRQVCQLGAGVACIFLSKKELQVQNAQRRRWTEADLHLQTGSPLQKPLDRKS